MYHIKTQKSTMKILLLKPISDTYYVIQPNLGLGYLATILLENGHDVHILDSGKEKLTWEWFAKKIQQEKYDIIGIQMLTHEILSVKKHSEIIKEFSPDTTILVGGTHMSSDPAGAMALLQHVNFGFVGEAEIGIEKFIKLNKKDYSNKSALEEIPGLVWRLDEKIIANPKAQFNELDAIKYPAWNLMPPSSYPVAPHGNFCKKTPVAPIIVTRGCPFQCTFCAGKMVTGSLLRSRSLENVINEIILLYKNYGVREFHIEDDNFTLKRDYVINFCNKIIELDLGIVFALPNGIRLDTLDEGLLKMMERAGFYSAAVGIESGNNRILNLMQKSLSKETIREKTNLIKSCTKMSVTGFFLIGYPGETESEILETIEFAKSLKIDKASFMFLMPLPGSKLWDIYKEQDKKEISWEDFFYYRIVRGFSDIPAKRLRQLHKKAIREFYLRPKILLGLLKEIKTKNQFKILIKRFFNIFFPATVK